MNGKEDSGRERDRQKQKERESDSAEEVLISSQFYENNARQLSMEK